MSLWSTLAGLVAAPFTGGISAIIGPALDAAGTVGSVLGKQQQGAAQGQVSQAELQQAQDRNALSAYQTEQTAQNQAAQTDLERKAFANTNRGTTAKQALIARLLGGGYQPTSISTPGIPHPAVSGGLARSLSDPDIQAAMGDLFSQAHTAQDAPLSFQGGQILTPPKMTPLPNVSGSGVLSSLANIGQLLGAVSPYIKKPGATSYAPADNPYIID